MLNVFGFMSVLEEMTNHSMYMPIKKVFGSCMVGVLASRIRGEEWVEHPVYELCMVC